MAAQAGEGYGPDSYSATDGGAWAGAEEACRQATHDETRCDWSASEVRIKDQGARSPGFEAVGVPEAFFDDTGGVGPAFADFGGWGGGGRVIAGGGAFARASAYASASARASVSVRFRGGGGRPPMMHGCGCGHRW
jgi:hypothetical protein